MVIITRLDAKRVVARAEGGVHSGCPLPIDGHMWGRGAKCPTPRDRIDPTGQPAGNLDWQAREERIPTGV